MAITNEQIQSFVSNNEALEKAKAMNLDTFKNSLGEFGLEGVTPQEAETVKKLIDFAVKKSNELNEEALDMAAGGISKAGVNAIVGAISATAGIGIGLLGKTLWDKRKLKSSDVSIETVDKTIEAYNRTHDDKIKARSIRPDEAPTK